jgi:hypothetical protein
MPAYINSAFPHEILRMGNNPWPNYLFGSFDTKTQPFLFNITNVALTSNVATITVTIVSGGGPGATLLPVVGQIIGVRGTQTNGGAFNVDPTTITAVSINNATGTGTISYAVTHANVTSTADVGQASVLPLESGDLVAAGSSSRAVALTSTPDESDNSRSIFAEAKWSGTLPTTATVVLQVANVDQDSRYYAVENAQGVGGTSGATVAASDALATVAGSAVTQSGAEYSFIMGKFIRAKVLSMTGGDGTTALVVTVSA